MAQVRARRAAKGSNGSKCPLATSTTKTSAQGKDKAGEHVRDQTREPPMEKRVPTHPPAKAKSVEHNVVDPRAQAQAVVDQERHTLKKTQKSTRHVTPVDEDNADVDQEDDGDHHAVVYRESKKPKASTATRGASNTIHPREQHTSKKTQKSTRHVTPVDEDNADVDQEDEDDYRTVVYRESKKTKASMATRGASNTVHPREQHPSKKTQKTAHYVTPVDEDNTDVDREGQDDNSAGDFQWYTDDGGAIVANELDDYHDYDGSTAPVPQDTYADSPLSQLPDDMDDETASITQPSPASVPAKFAKRHRDAAATNCADDDPVPPPQKKKKASSRPQTIPKKRNPSRKSRPNGF